MFLRIGRYIIRWDRVIQILFRDDHAIIWLVNETGSPIQWRVDEEDFKALSWFFDTFGAQFQVNNVTDAYKNREEVERQLALMKEAAKAQAGANKQEGPSNFNSSMPFKPRQKVQSIKRDEVLLDETENTTNVE